MMATYDKTTGYNAPPIVIQNGIEFVSTEEAANRLGVSLNTISYHTKQGHLKPFRIPGIRGSGRGAYYFKADQVRGLMS